MESKVYSISEIKDILGISRTKAYEYVKMCIRDRLETANKELSVENTDIAVEEESTEITYPVTDSSYTCLLYTSKVSLEELHGRKQINS